jgi:hypothetical protein
MLYEFKQPTLLSDNDWTNTQKIAEDVINRCTKGNFDKDSKFETSYNAMIYNMGVYGAIILNTNHENNLPWYNWTGKLLDKTLPWSKKLKEQLKLADLNFVNFSYFVHHHEIYEHIDGKTEEEKLFEGHCNINYVISCESQETYTYVSNGEKRETYNSNTSSAWLLNTSLPHGIKNKGKREVFQIKFHSPFEKVCKFLQENPSILKK